MSDEVSEVVAEDRAHSCGNHNPDDVEVVRRSRVQGRRDERRFARKRNAGRLQADDDEDGEIAVLRNEVGQGTVKTTFPVFCSVSTYLVASTTSLVAPGEEHH